MKYPQNKEDVIRNLDEVSIKTTSFCIFNKTNLHVHGGILF